MSLLPEARKALSASSRVMRSRFMAELQNDPSRASRVGSDRSADAKLDERTDRNVTRNCNRISKESAAARSARATDSCRMMADSVEPRATVTTRSKALSLASVRLPEIRRNRTNVA